MQHQPTPDKHRVEHVVDEPDHGGAPKRQQKRAAPLPRESEIRRHRRPYDEGAEEGHDGEKAHDDTPEQRRGNIQPPEHHAAEGALQGATTTVP